MPHTDVIIIGAGPCGLSAAIELQKKGLTTKLIEKGMIVNAIYNYPTHQTFFSSSIKLSIGDIPFITAKEKPKRNDALVYYRYAAEHYGLDIHSGETVSDVIKEHEHFQVLTDKGSYYSRYVVVATGYYDQPNRLHVPGEDLQKVSHYFKEAHPYFRKKVVVIGGKNSAVDAAIELQRAGAEVTVVYHGSEYSKSVKPWILPSFESAVRNGLIAMHFESEVTAITENTVVIKKGSGTIEIENDFVFAMIGYHPDHQFFRKIGMDIDETFGKPVYNEETMETNVPGLFIAGVIAAGNDANRIFIENGRFHGKLIADAVKPYTE